MWVRLNWLTKHDGQHNDGDDATCAHSAIRICCSETKLLSIDLQILQHSSLNTTKKESGITGLLSQTFGTLMFVDRIKFRGCNLNEFQYGA